MPSILIVDSSITYREILSLEMKARFLQASTAKDGATALELFAELLPDVVIANIDLPVVNGLELCRRLKAEKPEVHVILIAARTSMHTTQRAREVGADHFCNKIGLMMDLDMLLKQFLPQYSGQAIAPLDVGELQALAAQL
jgi:two-component system OmpR family response regulator